MTIQIAMPIQFCIGARYLGADEAEGALKKRPNLGKAARRNQIGPAGPV
jgi:hypothetical protein